MIHGRNTERGLFTCNPFISPHQPRVQGRGWNRSRTKTKFEYWCAQVDRSGKRQPFFILIIFSIPFICNSLISLHDPLAGCCYAKYGAHLSSLDVAWEDFRLSHKYQRTTGSSSIFFTYTGWYDLHSKDSSDGFRFHPANQPAKEGLKVPRNLAMTKFDVDYCNYLHTERVSEQEDVENEDEHYFA